MFFLTADFPVSRKSSQKSEKFWFRMICHETRVKVRISRVISSKTFYANWIMAQNSILGWKSWKFSSKSTREFLGNIFVSQKVWTIQKVFLEVDFHFRLSWLDVSILEELALRSRLQVWFHFASSVPGGAEAAGDALWAVAQGPRHGALARGLRDLRGLASAHVTEARCGSQVGSTVVRSTAEMDAQVGNIVRACNF